MASQEFLVSFAVEIDEGGVTRLQQVLSENRDLANEVAAAIEAATAAINEYQKAALGGDNPSGEGNRDDGSGKGGGSGEGSRDNGSPYNPEASARNLENGEYRMGLCSVSAPVLDRAGTAKYAVGIVGIARDGDLSAVLRGTSPVLAAADALSRKLKQMK